MICVKARLTEDAAGVDEDGSKFQGSSSKSYTELRGNSPGINRNKQRYLIFLVVGGMFQVRNVPSSMFHVSRLIEFCRG
jgi:hypothetical protein